MNRMLLRGGRIIDPANQVDLIGDLLVEHGRIVRIADSIDRDDDMRVVNVQGLLLTPGLIDAHVHFRDPGFTYKGDLDSEAKAALAGGFVRVCCMPNTNPPLDTPAQIQDIVERGAATGIHIHPIGTITQGRLLHDIAPLRALSESGAIGFSDDGESTISVAVMREALILSKELNRPIMVHCEDPVQAAAGAMHRGQISTELGDPGIPADAEESFIARDIAIAEETGGWLHVLHVSTVRGAELIRQAKGRGVRVTAEVMPHHLALTDEWVAGRRRFAGGDEIDNGGQIDLNAKVNPPLRPEHDALGLVEYVRNGTFDFIATDHAPHSVDDKEPDLASAAFGMLGLELAIPTLAVLVRRGVLDWPDVIDLLTQRPATTLNLAGGTLSSGAAADITVIDPDKTWSVSGQTLESRSSNSPLLGMTVQGRAMMTIIRGDVLHNEL